MAKEKTAEEKSIDSKVIEGTEALNITQKRDWTEYMEKINIDIEKEKQEKYQAYISNAAEKYGLTEQEAVDKVMAVYSEALDEFTMESFRKIMQIWLKTEVSPIPLYEKILNECCSAEDFAITGDILISHSRNQLQYPKDRLRKWSKIMLDENRIDDLMKFHYKTNSYPDEDIVQEGYSRLAMDKNNRALMHGLIARTKIHPDKERMEEAAKSLMAQGRCDELSTLEYILNSKSREIKYELHNVSDSIFHYLNQ